MIDHRPRPHAMLGELTVHLQICGRTIGVTQLAHRVMSLVLLGVFVGCAPMVGEDAMVADRGDGGDAGAARADAGPSAFVSRVISFEPGEGAGFGQSRMPDIILGPPQGRSEFMGSLDVLSLGRGGKICLGFDRDIGDGPGADFIVFENAFRVLGTTSTFVELGEVSVSQDGVRFVIFACNPLESSGYTGCAGAHPVLSSSANGVNPLNPAVAGGDAFDLQSVGLQSARVVCIRDLSSQPLASPNSGFDLDSIGAIHQQ